MDHTSAVRVLGGPPQIVPGDLQELKRLVWTQGHPESRRRDVVDVHALDHVVGDPDPTVLRDGVLPCGLNIHSDAKGVRAYRQHVVDGVARDLDFTQHCVVDTRHTPIIEVSGNPRTVDAGNHVPQDLNPVHDGWETHGPPHEALDSRLIRRGGNAAESVPFNQNVTEDVGADEATCPRH